MVPSSEPSVGDPSNSTNYIVAFDTSGNVHWLVPNDRPQIATNLGGVIGASGITYNANGSATGQVAVVPTESWQGNDYEIDSIHQIVAALFKRHSPFGAIAWKPIWQFYCGSVMAFCALLPNDIA